MYHWIEREILHRLTYESSEAYGLGRIVLGLKKNGNRSLFFPMVDMDYFGFYGDPVAISWDLMAPLDRARRVVGGLLLFFCGLVAQANRHGK